MKMCSPTICVSEILFTHFILISAILHHLILQLKPLPHLFGTPRIVFYRGMSLGSGERNGRLN